jgi:hypothetical protein
LWYSLYDERSVLPADHARGKQAKLYVVGKGGGPRNVNIDVALANDLLALTCLLTSHISSTESAP